MKGYVVKKIENPLSRATFGDADQKFWIQVSLKRYKTLNKECLTAPVSVASIRLKYKNKFEYVS